MISQQQRIKELLPIHGWEIAEVRKIERLWVYEIWKINSVWSPIEAEFYLIFTVDSHFRSDEFDKTGWMSAVSTPPIDWAIETHEDVVQDAENAEIASSPIGKNQEKHFEEFFSKLAAFRNGF